MSDEEPEREDEVAVRAPSEVSRISMAATFQVSTPEPFNFSCQADWTKWRRRFERFRKVSGLETRGQEAQVNTLIYTMGDEADDILRSFGLSDEDSKEYQPMIDKFEAHFVKKRNVIYERARFNMRRHKRRANWWTASSRAYTLSWNTAATKSSTTT